MARVLANGDSGLSGVCGSKESWTMPDKGREQKLGQQRTGCQRTVQKQCLQRRHSALPVSSLLPKIREFKVEIRPVSRGQGLLLVQRHR